MISTETIKVMTKASVVSLIKNEIMIVIIKIISIGDDNSSKIMLKILFLFLIGKIFLPLVFNNSLAFSSVNPFS